MTQVPNTNLKTRGKTIHKIYKLLAKEDRNHTGTKYKSKKRGKKQFTKSINFWQRTAPPPVICRHVGKSASAKSVSPICCLIYLAHTYTLFDKKIEIY